MLLVHVIVLWASICWDVGLTSDGSYCDRRPVKNLQVTKSPGNNGFRVAVRSLTSNQTVGDQAVSYVPGEKYAVVVEGWKTRYTIQTFRGFTLVALAEGKEDIPSGFFQTKEDSDVRWSADCWHAVTHSSLSPKVNATAVWQAPPDNEGCVLFKAAVLEYPNIWYMDDDELTNKLCVLDGHGVVEPTDDMSDCCSCDEAKYELVFDGLWSRQTHPKDYPTLEHLTHFSDLIGASHSTRYSMWALGGYANDGMKELAEWGNTQKYEEEIREQKTEVRTIIKARGLWYPNVQGTTRAMFRVNRYHHLVSLASMLGPSPDWIVGVSSFNLCLKNCSWLEEKTFHLFPIDSGVDSGLTYMSPNNPTVPREPIKAITTKDPADVRAPFYNPDSTTMPPFAKLTFRREKVYPLECKQVSEYILASRNKDGETETSEDLENKGKKECTVNNWTPWSLCSASCGKGIRMRTRVYRNPIKAHLLGCSRQMNEKQFCNALISVCDGSENFNDQCSATTWAQWTACTANCGYGSRSRVRNYLNPMAVKMCSIALTEHENCTGLAGPSCDVKVDEKCQTTSWSEWSPCSRSCDQGVRLRTRLLYYPENQEYCKINEIENDVCNVISCDAFMQTYASEICTELVERGQCDGVFPRYYYDGTSKICKRFTYTGCKGNRNNFVSEEQCLKVCKTDTAVDGQQIVDVEDEAGFGLPEQNASPAGAPRDCVISGWSAWSECSQSCGRGRKQRVRTVVKQPQNGGNPCPEELVEKARCRLPACPTVCRIGAWTDWSACSVDCGTGVQMRQRFAPKRRPAECPGEQTEKRICVVDNC